MDENNFEAVRDMEISGEYKLNPGHELHYGRVTITDNGYFWFTGDFKLEIDELIIQKAEGAKKPYEFLIQTPNGNKGETGMRGGDAIGTADVKITIHSLRDCLHVKSIGGNGGRGGDGIVGASGGNGGDAVDVYGHGGTGGSGGDGGCGADGGNGAPAACVKVVYTADNRETEVLVLAKDNAISSNPISFGGEGGKKGAGGEGGAGGNGGRNGDGSRADDGKQGNPGKEGVDGVDAENGRIDINREENAETN